MLSSRVYGEKHCIHAMLNETQLSYMNMRQTSVGKKAKLTILWKCLLMCAIIGFTISENAHGQSTDCLDVYAKSIDVNRDGKCAPITLKIAGSFSLGTTFGAQGCDSVNYPNLATDMAIVVEWGDGTSSQINIKPGRVTRTKNTYKYYFSDGDDLNANYDSEFEHIYAKGHDVCSFQLHVYLKYKSSHRPSDAIIFSSDNAVQIKDIAQYFQTDDYSGSSPLILKESNAKTHIYPVCVGQEATIRFTDFSRLNCAAKMGDLARNLDPRYIQFGYGEGSGSSNIDGIKINGLPFTSTFYDGGTKQNDGDKAKIILNSNDDYPSTGISTSQIFVPGNTTVADIGKEFYVTMYNWNQCNLDPGNRAIAIKTEAIVRIVPAPEKPEEQEKIVCVGSEPAAYNITLTHSAPLTNGKYEWYLDDGTGTQPDEVKGVIFSTTTQNFNPTDAQFIKYIDEARLYPSVAAKKIYWVKYVQTNQETNVFNEYNCESPYAKIVFFNLDQLTPPPAEFLQACIGETITLYAMGAGGTLQQSVADPTRFHVQYRWTFGSGVIFVDANADSTQVKVKLTATGALTATVTKRWREYPDICTPPNAMKIITVHALPTVNISGINDLCEGESATIIVKNFGGSLVADRSFKIQLTGQATASTFTVPSTNPQERLTSIPYSGLDPLASGGIHEIRVLTLMDMVTGCVNDGLTSSVQVVTRPRLTLTTPAAISGKDEVCEGSSVPYTMAGASADTKTITDGGSNTTTRTTQFKWTFDSNPVQPSTSTPATFQVGSAVDRITNGVRNVSVQWQYTTPTVINGSASTNYCPSNTLNKPIQVLPKPTAIIHPAELFLCVGAQGDILVNFTGTPNKDWKYFLKNTPGSSYTSPYQSLVPGNGSGKVANHTPYGGNLSFPTAGTYTFTLDSVSQGQCSNSSLNNATIQIEVMQSPNVTIAANVPNCEAANATIPITISGAGYNNATEFLVTYTSSYMAGSQPPQRFRGTGNHQLIIDKTIINQADGAQTYITLTSVTEITKDTGGTILIECTTSLSNVYTITTVAKPTAANAGADDGVCWTPTTKTISLVANSPSGHNGAWRTISGPTCAGTSFSNLADPNAVFTSGCAGIYLLEWSLSNGSVCPPSRDTVKLTFGSLPGTASIIGDKDQRICGTTAILKGNVASAGEEGKWILTSSPPGAQPVSFTDVHSHQTRVQVVTYGEYKFRWTLSTPCGLPSQSDEVILTFIESPVVNPVANQEICSGASSNIAPFTSTTAGVTFGWSEKRLPTGALNTGTGNYTNKVFTNADGVNKDAYRIGVVAKNNGCISDSVSFTLTVKPKPQMSRPDSTVCAGTPVVFKLAKNIAGDYPVNYQWENTGNPAITSAVSPQIINNNPFTYSLPTTNVGNDSITGLFKISANVNGCVSDILRLMVQVNPIPNITVPADMGYCPNTPVPAGTIVFSSTVKKTEFIWGHQSGSYTSAPLLQGSKTATGSDLSVALDAFTTIDNTSASISETIRVSGTANGCTSPDKTFKISVNQRPNFSINNQTACPEDDGSVTFAPRFFVSNNVALPASVTYTWAVYDASNHMEKDGTGNFENTIFNPDATRFMLDNLTLNDKELNMVVEGSANGCVGTATAKLIIKARPIIELTPQVACPGDQVNITFRSRQVSGVSNYSFVWNNDETATGLSASGSVIGFSDASNVIQGNIPSFIATNSANTTFIQGNIRVRASYPYVKEGATAYCVGPEQTTTLTINPRPQLKNIPNDQTICAGVRVPKVPLTTQLTDPQVQVTYAWNTIMGSNLNIFSNSSISSGYGYGDSIPGFTAVYHANPAPTARINVTAAATYNGLGCTSSASYQITVQQAPSITAPASVAVCPGKWVLLSGISNSTSDPIYWTFDGVSDIIDPVKSDNYPSSGTGTPPSFWAVPNHTGSPIERYYTLKTSNTQYACTAPDKKIKVVLNPTPDVFFEGTPRLAYCDGSNVTLPDFKSNPILNGLGTITYHWERPSQLLNIGGAASGTTSSNHVTTHIPFFEAKNPSENKLKEVSNEYRVYATLNGCVGDTMSFQLTVHPVPQMYDIAHIASCSGTEITPDEFRLLPTIEPLPADADTNPDYFSWEITSPSQWFPESGIPGPPFGPVRGYLPTFTPDTIWGNMPQSIVIRVTPELNNCPGESKNILLTVNPIPQTAISAFGDNCIPADGIKAYDVDSYKADSKYTWGIEHPNPSTGIQPVFMNGANTGGRVRLQFDAGFDRVWEADLTLVEQNVFGCTGEKVFKHIAVMPKPIVDAGPDTVICSGQALVLNAKLVRGHSSNVTYEWNGGSISSDRNSLHPVINLTYTTPTVVSMYLRAILDGSCQGDFDTIRILVNPTPQALNFEDKAYCTSDKFMKMDISGGITHQVHWQRIEGTTAPYIYQNINNSTDSVSLSMNLASIHPNALPNSHFTTDTTIMYQVYQINQITGCTSPVSVAQMLIKQVPERPVIQDVAYCYKEQHIYHLEAQAIPQGQYSYIAWYEDAGKQNRLGDGIGYDIFQAGSSTFNGVNYVPFKYYAVAIGTSGCHSEMTEANLTIYPAPDVDFEHNFMSPNSRVCPPTPVIFTNKSVNTDLVTYVWDFGDGSALYPVNTLDSITYRYTNSTTQLSTKHIFLTATNSFGCVKSTDQFLSVGPQVIAEFVADTVGCAPVNIQFVSTTIGATGYRWRYGDGEPDDIDKKTTNHLFNNNTISELKYDVRLVTSNRWCSDSVSHAVHIYPKPNADFSVDVSQGCQPLVVIFNNTSNNLASDISYAYNFDDTFVDVSGDVLIPHEYPNLSGQSIRKQPTLTATNEWGCIATHSTDIIVAPYIKANFIMNKDAGCSPLRIDFTNGSEGYMDSEWWFGDGTTSLDKNTRHTFNNPSMSVDANYKVTLIVSTGGVGGCTDTMTRTVKVYGTPKAQFTLSPLTQDYIGRAPIAMNHLISDSPLQYTWSVAPYGSYTRGNVISHDAHPSPYMIDTWGKFDFQQKITNNAGLCPDSLKVTVTIIAPAPVAGFEPVAPGCAPYKVQFIPQAPSYADYYEWKFGDGSYASYATNPEHTYWDAGTYVVKLIVRNSNGQADSIEHTVVVNPTPQIVFEVKPESMSVGQSVRAFNYTNHATSTGQSYPVWYRWDWGDNSPTDTLANPLHVYQKAGDFTITLTAGTYTNPQCVASVSLTKTLQVNDTEDIVLPNAFKPSIDGVPSNDIHPSGYQNNLFYPPVLSPVRKYSLTIFNRWGQMIFETKDPTKGWNGYHNGRLCDEGIYIYKIEGVFETGQSFSKMGDLLLLR